jgi:protein TonB
MDRRFLALAILAASPPLAGCIDKSSPPRPLSPVGAYLSSDDYPAAAIRGEEQGVTQVRLTVGPDGRIADCRLSRSSGSAALDRATCRILARRMRFHPALDRKGRLTAGSFEARIDWRLPPK